MIPPLPALSHPSPATPNHCTSSHPVIPPQPITSSHPHPIPIPTRFPSHPHPIPHSTLHPYPPPCIAPHRIPSHRIPPHPTPPRRNPHRCIPPPSHPTPAHPTLPHPIRPLRIRYFASSEIALLHGFPPSFTFPPAVGRKKQYELLGNSLSVQVVAELLRFLVSPGRPAAELSSTASVPSSTASLSIMTSADQNR